MFLPSKTYRNDYDLQQLKINRQTSKKVRERTSKNKIKIVRLKRYGVRDLYLYLTPTKTEIHTIHWQLSVLVENILLLHSYSHSRSCPFPTSHDVYSWYLCRHWRCPWNRSRGRLPLTEQWYEPWCTSEDGWV